MMDSTERVLRAINFQKTDRIPLWHVHHYAGFNERWRKFLGLGENVEPKDYYGYDTAVFGPDESFFPSEKRLISDEGDYYIENDGFGRITRRKKDGYFPQILQYKLSERNEIDSIEFEKAEIDSRYTELDAFSDKNSHRCRFARTGGLYIRAHALWPEDKLLMDMLFEPDFCGELFDLVCEHMTAMAVESIKRTGWGTGIWVYDDMANSLNPMFSPDLFGRYLLPRYKKFIKACENAGCSYFFFHSDGNISPLMDMLVEAGFDGFNPLEPRCGLHLPKLREKYKDIVFFGGVCNTEILQTNDRGKIKEHIEPLIETAKSGGVLLGMASASGDIPPEAYDYYMSLIKDRTLHDNTASL